MNVGDINALKKLFYCNLNVYFCSSFSFFNIFQFGNLAHISYKTLRHKNVLFPLFFVILEMKCFIYFSYGIPTHEQELKIYLIVKKGKKIAKISHDMKSFEPKSI